MTVPVDERTTDEAGTAVDMHVKVLDHKVMQRARARGLDGLVYAPHFTRLPEIRDRAQRYATEDVAVVPAREVFTGDYRTRRHLLAIGLSEPVPDFITFEGALAELRRQDAAILVPHPGFANVSLTHHEIAAYGDHIHAVETHNAKLFGYQNRRGVRIARELGLPGFGSSYAHLRSTVGEAWTRFDGLNLSRNPTRELTNALRDGVERRAVHRSGASHRVRRFAEYGHLFYENSWGKLDRLFLSGTEPTHPRQVAYDGRFDDVAVY